MVNHKNTKRKRDIKTKLMAAICMLMVSVIMMVSTTYAWFTLSTAPEVTGINTAVGANGNLEMALMPADGLTQGSINNFGITSEAGDSTKSADLKNITWGNLVDVSNNEFYGLEKITLYPAALNATEAGNLADIMLKTPTYGADGRVADLLANTVTSIYDSTAKSFPQANGLGVRAVGTASGMTDRQLAYRNARSAANTAMAMAKTLSSQSLNANGASLANIAISHAANSGTANDVYTSADVAKLLAIINDLLGTADTTGVLEYIENAYLNYIVALGASAQSGITDEEFKVFEAAVTAEGVDVYEAVALCTEHGVTLDAALTDPIAKLQATRTTVQNAKEGLEAITDESGISWGAISTPMSKLANMDAMEINGFAASSFREHMSEIINGVASGGLTVSMVSGGGVYADVADHCGDFTASIVIEEVTYNGLTLSNMNARMKTESNVNPAYLVSVGAAAEAAGAPSGLGGQVMPISDFYGYIIDLAFRTNAAESNLLLQTEAVDRIYNNNGADAETMGHGSTMTFVSTTPDFTVDQLKSLMGAIRVVFFDPMDSNKILGTAKLDVANATVTGGNTVTAGLYLYKTTAASVSYEEADATVVAAVADGTDTNTKLYIAGATEGTYEAVGADATIDTTGATTYYVQVSTAAGELKLTGPDAVITALTQNTATAVSALVYLDGEYVGNDDVAATAATSMSGTMNLQFASSATLVPMEYTPLIVAGTTTEGN